MKSYVVHVKKMRKTNKIPKRLEVKNEKKIILFSLFFHQVKKQEHYKIQTTTDIMHIKHIKP